MSTKIQTIYQPAQLKFSDWLAEDTFAVFLFHGIVDECNSPVRNYLHKHITTQIFRQSLEDLTDYGAPISMDEVIKHQAQNRPLPPRSFAVTFDDGFENNYSIAAPILSEFNVPATFYITTGFVQNNLMSWIDRIENCFEQIAIGKVLLPWNDKKIVFETVHQKIAILEEIRANAKSDPIIDVDLLADDILAQCKMPNMEKGSGPLDQKMTWSQVAELDKSELFTIGGHTHTHRILAHMENEDLEAEINMSLHLLREHCSVNTKHYSYPEGMDYCLNDKVIKVLKKYGIECCPTAEPGVNHLYDDLFRLRRINVTP